MSRTFRALLPALIAVLLLAGCSASPAPAGDAPAGGGAFPVTVAHAYGSTEITAAPQRVVTLGYTDPDALLAVGVAPVGIVDWFATPPAGNRWLWQEPGFRGATPQVVGVREEVDLEKVAALQPDLIVASYSDMTRERYEQVSRIAPTVAQPPGFAPFTAPWQVMTRQLTTAVGQQRRGDELVADVEARLARARDAHPRWAGQTALAASYQSPDYFAFAAGDIKADLLRGLGFRVPDGIAPLAGGRSDARISPERADLLDVDKLLVLAPNPQARTEIENRPEFRRLAAVRENRTVFLLSSERDEPVPAALGYGSVLSLPYAVDRLVTRLDALPEPG